MDLAFVLVSDTAPLDPARVVAAAARLGITLHPVAGPDTERALAFEIEGGGQLVAMPVQAPHPDAPRMLVGATSPTREEASAAPAHVIVTALGLEGTARARDTRMAALTAAVIDSTSAIGAMLGHGVMFHHAALFSEMAALGVEEGELPAEIAIDVSGAPEGPERMSFLTHGMVRYGREELYVTCPQRGRGALGFVLTMARWLLTDLDKQLPTGDTVGRTEDEKIVIRRVPHPAGEGPAVIRLDLPS